MPEADTDQQTASLERQQSILHVQCGLSHAQKLVASSRKILLDLNDLLPYKPRSMQGANNGDLRRF